MTLKEGKNHQTYIVKSINIDVHLERRLESLGLTDGSCVTILNNDKHGSLSVKFRGTRFAMGRRIADQIEISEVVS